MLIFNIALFLIICSILILFIFATILELIDDGVKSYLIREIKKQSGECFLKEMGWESERFLDSITYSFKDFEIIKLQKSVPKVHVLYNKILIHSCDNFEEACTHLVLKHFSLFKS